MVREEKGILPKTKPERIPVPPRLKGRDLPKISEDQAREFAENIIAAVREPLIVLDQDLRVISASLSFYEVFKVKPEDTIGQLIYDLGNKQWNIPKLRELLETILPQKTTFDDYEVEHDFVTIGRRIMLLNARQIQRVLGKEKIILLAIEDITKRVKIANSLRELEAESHLASVKALGISQETLRLVMDTLHVGVALTDLKGTILHANKAMVLLYGSHSGEEVIGKNILAIVDKNDYSRALEKMNKVAAEGDFRDAEFILLRSDGSNFQAELSASIIKDSSGVHHGIVVLARDVTERRELLEQVMAQDRLASIGQLVAGVSHEIKNPLTSVIGFSELLLTNNACKDFVDDLKIINDESKRIVEIVNNLLTFAKKQPEGKAEIQINEQIERVIALRSHDHKANNIQVISELAPDLPPVIANSSQILQVLFNIVVNAEQALLEAHSKGTLTITTDRVGDAVRVSIADNGPGISEGNMKKLFIPFFTTKGVVKGTGLGLSICHGIITEHGGKIYVESELGNGATFIVELPISQSPNVPETVKVS